LLRKLTTDFEPDPAVVGELGLDRSEPIVVVRTPPSVSLYHRFGFSERYKGEPGRDLFLGLRLT